MNAAAKLAAYGLLLAGMIGGGAAIGAAVDPIDTGDGGDQHGAGHSGSTPEATPASAELPAGGLLVSQDGYTFNPGRPHPRHGADQPLQVHHRRPRGSTARELRTAP